MREIILPKKTKKSFFTKKGAIALSIGIFLLILLAVGWSAYELYQEGAAIQQDGGLHTVEGWKAIPPK